MTKCGGCWGGTVYQDEYRPTVGIPVSEVPRQNGVFTDCRFVGDGGGNGWVVTDSEGYGQVVTEHGPWYTVPVTEAPAVTGTKKNVVGQETATSDHR